MLFILHRDLINGLNINDSELASTLLGTWIEWIAGEVNDLIDKRVSQLPVKAPKDKEPIVYWTSIPSSNHFDFKTRAIHAKFNNTLETVMKMYNRMRVIKLKYGWNPENADLVSHILENWLTDDGYHSIWRAIDASVHFNLIKRQEYLN